MKIVDRTSFDRIQSSEMLLLIFQWFTDNQRALPWRINYTPYEVWISEMMLQQTQMERGVAYYLRWMKQFSSIEDVAHASESDILQAWEGLGYYSRARNLHATAKIICEKHAGKIPCDADILLTFPGIGDYTVAAIMGISFEKDFPTVDANVERVFSRLCNIESNNLKSIVKEEVVKIFPKGKARIFNQAWMEFGALICKKVPQCQNCPITKYCVSYTLNVQNLRPIPKKKPDIIPVYASFCIIHHVDRGYLLHKRPNKGLWANMWEFVGVDSFMLDSEQKENKTTEISKTTKTSHPMTTDLFCDLARLVLIKEIENIFDGILNIDSASIDNALNDRVNNQNNMNQSNMNQNNTNQNNTKENNTKEKDTQEENTLNIFSHAPYAHVKHSYTNHRLQALFYKWHIGFDLVLREDYKWVKDIKSVAMPAHHRKAAKKL